MGLLISHVGILLTRCVHLGLEDLDRGVDFGFDRIEACAGLSVSMKSIVDLHELIEKALRLILDDLPIFFRQVGLGCDFRQGDQHLGQHVKCLVACFRSTRVECRFNIVASIPDLF